jgi:hypothetical protein
VALLKNGKRFDYLYANYSTALSEIVNRIVSPMKTLPKTFFRMSLSKFGIILKAIPQRRSFLPLDTQFVVEYGN